MLKRYVTRLSASLALCLAFGTSAAAQVPGADDEGIVRTFAILPEVVEPDPNNPGQLLQLGHPEGLTVDSTGYVYVATFDAGFQNYIYVYDRGRPARCAP